MNWWQYLLLIVLLILETIIILVFRHSIPSYLEKKGENLATKQDVAEITRKTELIQKEFKEDLTRFSSDIKFKYDFYYKQYSELYCTLYAIVVQSEYARYYIETSSDQEVPFEDFPFIEVSPVYKEVNKYEDGQATSKNYVMPTKISVFNKTMLCDTIINNGRWATQRLLTLAVSYRFAFERSKETSSSPIHTYGAEEEFRLIKEISKCIVMEYNFFRRELKMDFNENELISGTINIKPLRSQEPDIRR